MTEDADPREASSRDRRRLAELQEKSATQPRMTEEEWTELFRLEKRYSHYQWLARHSRYLSPRNFPEGGALAPRSPGKTRR